MGLNNYTQVAIPLDKGLTFFMPKVSKEFGKKALSVVAMGQHHALCLEDGGAVYSLVRPILTGNMLFSSVITLGCCWKWAPAPTSIVELFPRNCYPSRRCYPPTPCTTPTWYSPLIRLRPAPPDPLAGLSTLVLSVGRNMFLEMGYGKQSMATFPWQYAFGRKNLWGQM